MSQINGIKAIWYREFKVFLREKSRIVSSLVTPLLWLVIFGGGLGSAVSIAGTNYQSFIFPGILIQSALFSSVFFGVYIVWDRKIDFLKEVLAAPISRFSMFMGKVVGGATDSIIQSTLLLILGFVLYLLKITPDLHLTIFSVIASLVILLITIVSMVSVGLIIGSMMESPEGFQLVGSFLLFPLFFLSGALFPISNLPAWLKPLNLMDPLTYSVDALRNVILGSSQINIWLDLGVITVFAVIVVAIGTYAFEKMRF